MLQKKTHKKIGGGNKFNNRKKIPLVKERPKSSDTNFYISPALSNVK